MLRLGPDRICCGHHLRSSSIIPVSVLAYPAYKMFRCVLAFAYRCVFHCYESYVIIGTTPLMHFAPSPIFRHFSNHLSTSGPHLT